MDLPQRAKCVCYIENAGAASVADGNGGIQCASVLYESCTRPDAIASGSDTLNLNGPRFSNTEIHIVEYSSGYANATVYQP